MKNVDIKNNINFFIPKEFCVKCKGCCKFSSKNSRWNFNLTNFEKRKLNDLYLIKNQDVYQCSFFKNNLCDKYIKRPFDCKLYPLLLNKKFVFLNNNIIVKYQLILDTDNCEYALYNQLDSINQANQILKQIDINLLKKNKQLFSNYNNINSILINTLFYEYKTRNN